MHTFLTTVALIVAAPAASWESNYSLAQQQAAAERKPLVVVFAPGSNGWSKVVRADAPAPELNKLLAEQYVCVFIDTATPQGSTLAHNFDVAGGVGMVISDRKGGSQAFWHQGDMTNERLVHYLTKYGDPHTVVTSTETIATQRTSYYPQANFAPAAARPANC